MKKKARAAQLPDIRLRTKEEALREGMRRLLRAIAWNPEKAKLAVDLGYTTEEELAQVRRS